MRLLNPTGLSTLQSVNNVNENLQNFNNQQNLIPIEQAQQLVNFNAVYQTLMNNLVKINAIIPDNFWNLQYKRTDPEINKKEAAIFCSRVDNINIFDNYFDGNSDEVNDTILKNYGLAQLAYNGYRIKQIKIACANASLFHNASINIYNLTNNIVKRSFSLNSFISEYSFKDNVLTIDCDIAVNPLTILALDTSILDQDEIVSILLKIDDYHIYTF